jgi:hypothetical protein
MKQSCIHHQIHSLLLGKIMMTRLFSLKECFNLHCQTNIIILGLVQSNHGATGWVWHSAQAPELNPIELVFHILAHRIRSFWYPMAGPCDAAAVRQTARVLNDVALERIVTCSVHCGY